jgi:hypothetical protein
LAFQLSAIGDRRRIDEELNRPQLVLLTAEVRVRVDLDHGVDARPGAVQRGDTVQIELHQGPGGQLPRLHGGLQLGNGRGLQPVHPAVTPFWPDPA